MSNLLIREARPDDAPVLLAAEKETARTPGLLVSRPHELTLQAFEQKIAELAQRGRYIVAEEDGRIAGHALLDPMPLEAISHVSGSPLWFIRNLPGGTSAPRSCGV